MNGCESIYQRLKTALETKFNTELILKNDTQALSILSSVSHPIILMVDPPTKELIEPLKTYIHNGGCTIACACFHGNFMGSNVITYISKALGLNWSAGSYYRTTNYLTPKGLQMFPNFPKTYSPKAVHVEDIPEEHRLFKPNSTSMTQSICIRAKPAHQNQTPLALAPVGKGYFVYAGDQNVEEDTAKMLVFIIDKLIELKSISVSKP